MLFFLRFFINNLFFFFFFYEGFIGESFLFFFWYLFIMIVYISLYFFFKHTIFSLNENVYLSWKVLFFLLPFFVIKITIYLLEEVFFY